MSGERSYSSRRFTQAAADLNRAISREPDSYSRWLLLARVETELGDLSLAVQDYNRAR